MRHLESFLNVAHLVTPQYKAICAICILQDALVDVAGTDSDATSVIYNAQKQVINSLIMNRLGVE